ncbi:hypothetical protein N1851_004518 [Merluccius polli]|uniref:Uncharacterized protein n=1 Tax=Merluccius polli TaxID=89951 RepID=A0AA47N8L3_MERPO|nr:hypothetical protein N1851_004518 [Merluccius polli]
MVVDTPLIRRGWVHNIRLHGDGESGDPRLVRQVQGRGASLPAARRRSQQRMRASSQPEDRIVEDRRRDTQLQPQDDNTAHADVMHGMPCSALNHCFGSDPSDVSTDQLPSQGPDGSSRCSRTDPGGLDPPGAEPVLSQPEPKPCGGGGGGPVVVEYSQSDWRCESLTSARSAHRHLDRHGSEHSHWLPTGEGELFGSRNSSVSQSSEENLDDDGGPRWALQYPLIPRPSIIIRQPGASYLESEWQETAADRKSLAEAGEALSCPGISLWKNDCLFFMETWIAEQRVPYRGLWSSSEPGTVAVEGHTAPTGLYHRGVTGERNQNRQSKEGPQRKSRLAPCCLEPGLCLRAAWI